MSKQVFSIRLEPKIIKNIKDYSRLNGFSVQETLNQVFSGKVINQSSYQADHIHPWAKFAGMDDSNQINFEKEILQKRKNNTDLRQKKLKLLSNND